MLTIKNKKMKGILIGSLILIAGVIVFVVTPTQKNKNMNFRQRTTKLFYPVIMKVSKSTILSNVGEQQIKPVVNFYSLGLQLINGTMLDFSTLKGKKIMIVNTASDCGFTGQYEELESLYQQHKDSLVIIGIPANDFANQENYSNEKIAGFCKINYGVTFPLAEKGIVIKNSNQLSLYKWLSDKSLNGWNDQAPTWNFCKYIIDENGTLTYFLNSSVSPLGKECGKALGF